MTVISEKWLLLLENPELRRMIRARLLQMVFEGDGATVTRSAEMFLSLGEEQREDAYAGLSIEQLNALRERARSWVKGQGDGE